MPAVISPDQDAINAQVEINAPPERVFQALIDSAQARTWGSTEHFETTVWVLEPRIGGKWKFVAKDCGTGKVYTHYGEVLEFDPPRVLEHTWMADFHEQPSRPTIVRWELSAFGSGTRLKVTHRGFADQPKVRKDYQSGWPGLLEAIRKYCESVHGKARTVEYGGNFNRKAPRN